MNIIIPGLHNSDENHWQSHWERLNPHDFRRVQQQNWEAPDCETWIQTIESSLADFPKEDLILIGHSIGCMAIVKWHQKYQHRIRGALLVAPSDAEQAGFPNYISGFSPIPKKTLPFPSIVVASTDDHVTRLERAQTFAEHWGSRLVILENAGHIESKSGFGPWPEGLDLLQTFE